ncbi:MAG: hypothetical protein GC151_17890 [Betaproteobacteria bacterium]|nr:hypothetical protein [Betaproteobacteria bacterium]
MIPDTSDSPVLAEPDRVKTLHARPTSTRRTSLSLAYRPPLHLMAIPRGALDLPEFRGEFATVLIAGHPLLLLASMHGDRNAIEHLCSEAVPLSQEGDTLNGANLSSAPVWFGTPRMYRTHLSSPRRAGPDRPGPALERRPAPRTAEASPVPPCPVRVDCDGRIAEVHAQFRQGNVQRGLEQLREVLSRAREDDWQFTDTTCHSGDLAFVLDAALRHSIEIDYAVALIRQHKLHPPGESSEAWPWAVRIYTLGRFEIQVNGQPLRFSGKAPRKPLALLKAIIAYGCRDVPVSRLMDALWPDEQGDAAKQAFWVTMVRLRKLLQTADAISVTDARVSLNAAICWTDAQAFESMITGLPRPSGTSERAETEDGTRRALTLYGGPFLPADVEESWSTRRRLRLSSLFTAAMENAGAGHEASEDWSAAIDCYRRGLEADDLVEAFYIGQMRCFLALGRHAEGLAVFRRLRPILSVVLGVTPSPASEKVARALSESGAVDHRTAVAAPIGCLPVGHR